MSTEFVEKMLSGLKHIAKGEDFEGKREVILAGLKCVEMYICEEENKDKDDEFRRLLETRVRSREEILSARNF